MFPSFIRIPLTFLLNWKVILILTIIGPLGSSLMHGDYPRLGLFLMMLMVVEHHCYFFEFFFIVFFYYFTKKQRKKTYIALDSIRKVHCLTEKEFKTCNRHILWKIGLLAFFLGSCGWSVAAIYAPIIIDWINTGTLIIPVEKF
jgi:hypothetical protein